MSRYVENNLNIKRLKRSKKIGGCIWFKFDMYHVISTIVGTLCTSSLYLSLLCLLDRLKRNTLRFVNRNDAADQDDRSVHFALAACIVQDCSRSLGWHRLLLIRNHETRHRACMHARTYRRRGPGHASHACGE